KLLDYKPEPWTTQKCALVLMNMSQKLSMSDKDMEMTNALKLYGKDIVDLLYPDREMADDPVVDKPGGWKFTVPKLDTVPLAVPEEFITVKKIKGADPKNGSNNWAVSGSKTLSGSPILCGDPHLSLSLPSIWYGVHLNAPGVNTMGASLPGAPCIIIGFTDSVAWSVTNAQRDLVDWFKIMYQDKTKNKYQLDGNWVDTKKVVEEFRIRDKEIFYDTVVYTHWGPVAYDENYHAENNLESYSFRWMAHEALDEVLALYKLNRAKNHTDFTEALNYFGLPCQNFVFAAVDGDIAMRVQGKYPVRRSGEGKFVLDGSKSSQGWQAIIPNEQNVMDKNPARGFVSSANQYPVDATYPYYINGASYEAYRNRRINQVLRESDSITVHDMMNLQNDNYNLKAAENLPYFLQQLDTATLDPAETQAYKILKAWDYMNTKESEGSSYFDAWFENLIPLVWDEIRSKQYALTYPTEFVTAKLLKEQPMLSFFDITSTAEKETAREVIQTAFKFAVEDIEEWKSDHSTTVSWAEYKDSYIANLLRLEPLGMRVRTSGSGDDVNAMGKTHGPSWRMVVSLEKRGVRAWAVYPGGQSGNPGSTHYNDMVSLWNKGHYIELNFARRPEDIKSASTLNLNVTAK
ncbi:MAG TPA: penicillin acylase family protein, partial [Ohtaekwangia sp.]